jgi:hypothetical protein
MRRHSFDPMSAALGVLSGALGILVASAGLDSIGADAGVWVAVGVLILGAGLIPWTRYRPGRHPDP